MKNVLIVLRLIILSSIYFIGTSFAGETAFEGVYLSCIDSNSNYYKYTKSYAEDVPNNSFDPLLKEYGSGVQGKKNISHKSGNNPAYLFLSGSAYPNDYVLWDGNEGDNNSHKGYLIFDTVGNASNFCQQLSAYCVKSNGPEYKYAVGGRPGVRGFFNLSIMYKEGNDIKTSICPTPSLPNFPNSGGIDPAPCKNCGKLY
jgi:hypothetical protein